MDTPTKEQLRKNFGDELPLNFYGLHEEEKDAIFEWFYSKYQSLLKENENLKTVMIAAAEEIQSQWNAHCDAEGYGPSNLMHRLEKGIASYYGGYNAGQFTKLDATIERQSKLLEKAEEVINMIESSDEEAMYLAIFQPKFKRLKSEYKSLKSTKPEGQ